MFPERVLREYTHPLRKLLEKKSPDNKLPREIIEFENFAKSVMKLIEPSENKSTLLSGYRFFHYPPCPETLLKSKDS